MNPTQPTDPPKRKWLYHTPPSWVRNRTYFVTICCQERTVNQLCQPSVAEKIFEAVQQYHEQQRWYVCLWLLMPDHLHALISCPQTESLAKVVAAWKRYIARQAGINWQRGFFDHRLRDDKSFELKAEYIKMNPVRKGLASTIEEWPYVWRPKAD